MSDGLKEALWWTLIFVVLGIVIATGARIVSWITEGETENVWRVALVLIGASAGGGKAVTAVIKHRNGETHE